MTTRRSTRRGSPLHLETAFGLFSKSRDLILKHFWIFAPLFFLILIFVFNSWAATPDLGSHTANDHWKRYSWFGSGFTTLLPVYLWFLLLNSSILWILFVLVAGTIIQIMAQSAQLQAVQHQQIITFGKLWTTVKQMGWQMIGLYLLMGLYIVVGLILLIVPGLIMMRRYFLAPFVLLDEKCSIKDAMEKSAHMTKPYSKSIWGIAGVMTLIGLVNILPFIGWMVAFVLGMLYSIAPALRYQELKKIHTRNI